MQVEVDAHFDQDALLPHPRTVAVVAALTLAACVVAIVPLAAFGDEPNVAPVSAEVQEVLELRTELDAHTAEAVEDAPEAVGERCRATLDVEGIGDSCVTSEGLLRVEQSDGRSHTVHGLDAPPLGASAFPSAAQAAVNGASVADVNCVDASTPHYVLVYARPGATPSRYETIAPLLREEIYKVSSFIDAESQSITPGASRRLPMLCDGGAPRVLDLQLTGLASGAASFGQIVDALRGHGLEFNGDGTNLQRYVVYYDSASPMRAAGTGHVFASDASAGAQNANNTGGLYAVEYRYAEGGGVPHWEVLIHEVLHTMGAVVSAAPHTSGTSGGAGAGHCTDGLDIMCYDDGGSRGASYDPTVCATKLLDCNRDDYFHPSPAAGSYLATHWNVAATYNRFLVEGAVRAPRSVTAPVVSGLRQTGTSDRAVGIVWGGSGSTFAVGIRQPNGSWRDVVTTATRSASVAGLKPGTSYELGVSADGASERATVTVTTSTRPDTKKPTRPGAVRVRRTASTLQLSWKASRDNVGVARYELRQLTNAKGRKLRSKPRSRGRTTSTSMRLTTRGLRPGTHRFQLVARDAAGNASAARTVRVVIRKDRTRPTRPARLRAKARTASTITIGWAASRDASGISRYVVSQRVGTKWVPLRVTLRARTTSLRVTKLRSGSRYTFRVQARDKAGNASLTSRQLTVRTR